MMPTRLLSSRPGKPTRLARQLAAAGLLGGLFGMLAVPAHADTGAAAGIARVVADGNPTTADDLIFTLRLDSGETLSAIRLDDDDTQRNLLAQFVRSPTADGRLSLRLTPPMDFDRLIGTPATLRLHIDGPQGSRELALPLAIAPVSALTETLTLRQVIADGAGSWTPRLPLRAAGNARLLAIADDQGAWAHRLSEADDRLQAEGENHLALPVTDVALAIVRELTPGGQRLIQPVSLQAQSFASLTAELDLLPDVLPDMLPAGTSDTPPRFTVPGAWNLDAGALILSGAPTSDLSVTFLVERLDNGDLRLTARSLPALSALGYPAAPLRLSLERHGAGQSATQSLRLHGSAASATAAPAAQSSHSGQISYRILPATPAEGRAASAPGGNASNATNTASPASPTTSLSPVAPTDASAKAAAAAAAGTASGPSPAPRSSPATDKLAPLASRADPAPATSTPLKAARVMSGDITQYQYDALGNRTRVTDPLARSVSTTWDALNRPKTLTQPAPDGNSASPVTQFEYDARDQLTRLTDARNLATRYAIDGLGQTRQLTSPDTGLSQSGYDAAGNLTAYTDARGQVQTRSYDVANRLTTIVHTGATGSQLARVELSYDQGVNGKGQLTGVTERDPAGNVLLTLAYTYDADGRLASETRNLPGTVASVQQSTWNPGGRLATLTLPSGRLISYTWTNGQLSAITSTPPGGSAQNIASNIRYHPFGGLKAYTLGNGQTLTRNRDTRGRLQDYTLGNATRSLQYDAADRIVGITDSADSTRSAVYTYDNLDRLTGSTQNGQQLGYRYDATGNRLDRLAGGQTDSSLIDPASNRIQSLTPAGGSARSYQYDAAGNLLNDGVRSLTYDARGRLIQAILGNAQSRYQLDTFGRRVRKNIGTPDEIVFHYDSAGHLIAETRPDGRVIRETLYLHNTPVAVVLGASL